MQSVRSTQIPSLLISELLIMHSVRSTQNPSSLTSELLHMHSQQRKYVTNILPLLLYFILSYIYPFLLGHCRSIQITNMHSVRSTQVPSILIQLTFSTHSTVRCSYHCLTYTSTILPIRKEHPLISSANRKKHPDSPPILPSDVHVTPSPTLLLF